MKEGTSFSRSIDMVRIGRRGRFVSLVVVLLGMLLVGVAGTVAADTGHDSDLCDFENAEWRDAQTVAGVEIDAEKACRPDNPNRVAAVTKGTNNVPMDVLMNSGLHGDAVRKHTDRDDDGDPDVIEITLEIHGINEHNETDLTHEIAPGVNPAFWTFAPKTRGMVREGSSAETAIRMPSPPLRVEQGDTVRITVENTHYFPHTLHLHGADHPFEVDGGGNDGVPQTSEKPILPGESRTYEFEPRSPGTMFYHCHVVPDVHVMMGLNGMLVVEENRSDNRLQTVNIGAGKVRHPSEAIDDEYDGEFDLHYQELDMELHRIPQKYDDPRRVAKQMNRNYDKGEADPDYFLLNGRSFPHTMRESLLTVEEDSRYRLRTLNGGSKTMSLHTHGHKVQIEAYDGVEVPEGQETTRDVVSLTAAQRVDLTLNTTDDGLHSYGDGIWFFHDHREAAVTNDGIGPGGTVTMITYDSHLRENGMPDTDRNLSKFFDEAYYRGEVPVWANLDEERFGDPPTGDDGGDGHDHSHDQQSATENEGRLGTVAATTESDGPVGLPVILAVFGAVFVLARLRRGDGP